MDNMIQYVAQNFCDYTAQPFHDVDSLVLSQIIYTNFDGLVPPLPEHAEGVPLHALLKAEHFADMFQNVLAAEQTKQLLFALAASPRFRDVRVSCFVNRHDEVQAQQFAAATFCLPDGTVYLAFRGTDTTFVGWKEDFNMAYVSPVPSQEAGLSYLEQVAALYPEQDLRLGGHSKGGNVAVYSAMRCSEATRARIRCIYSHDGPGFRKELLQDAAYQAVCARVSKTLPQDSVVGMLLQSHERYKVVRSNKLGGLLQHDPFSWLVKENAFVELEDVTHGAKMLRNSAAQWLETMSDDKRELMVEALWNVIQASGAHDFAEFEKNWRTGVPAMLKAMKELDQETRETLTEILKTFVAIAWKNAVPGTNGGVLFENKNLQP